MVSSPVERSNCGSTNCAHLSGVFGSLIGSTFAKTAPKRMSTTHDSGSQKASPTRRFFLPPPDPGGTGSLSTAATMTGASATADPRVEARVHEVDEEVHGDV